jgi:hypothetical protein
MRALDVADKPRHRITSKPTKERRKAKRRPYDQTRHRFGEFKRVIKDLPGGVVPDTDDAGIYLVPIIRCLRLFCKQNVRPNALTLSQRFQAFVESHAPDVRKEILDDAMDEAMLSYKIGNADEAAAQWRISYAQRQRLGLRTIGSYNVNKAGRKRLATKRRRERDRQRKAVERRASGKDERAVYLAGCLSRTKPWEAEGISRRTWERRRKAVEATRDAGPSPHIKLQVGGHTCVKGTAVPAAALPASTMNDDRGWVTPPDHQHCRRGDIFAAVDLNPLRDLWLIWNRCSWKHVPPPVMKEARL